MAWRFWSIRYNFWSCSYTMFFFNNKFFNNNCWGYWIVFFLDRNSWRCWFFVWINVIFRKVVFIQTVSLWGPFGNFGKVFLGKNHYFCYCWKVRRLLFQYLNFIEQYLRILIYGWLILQWRKRGKFARFLYRCKCRRNYFRDLAYINLLPFRYFGFLRVYFLKRVHWF